MNAHDDPKTALDDPRVIEALDEYLAALEGGQKPDRQSFLTRHGDIADALAECLDGMEILHEASSATHQPADDWTAPVDWQPGTPLGDFRIVREIARGGMGVVYEAEQLSLGRRIALKVLPFALTLDPRQLQRFKNEARAAAQLHHQHIVPVYYVGSERGVHFYAMQYIDGQSLAEVIEGLRQLADDRKASTSLPAPLSSKGREKGEGTAVPRRAPAAQSTTGPFVSSPEAGAAETVIAPMSALATAYSQNSRHFYEAAARLGMQAAEALEHAHEYGVVHRDIKPGNLLVDTHGHVWVTDFGLAQFQSDAGLTQTGDLLGTLRYMSPEQAGGRHVLLDHRTDVYSLGATLYELLTLGPTFDGTDRQSLLQQILHDEPRPLRAVRKSVPVELETIVLKCLEKEVGRRYATARELADDLRRFLAYEPIRARRATPAQRLRKWARRHPSVVWAGVALCVLTVVGSLISAGLLRREQANTQLAYEQERQRAGEAEERFLLAREELDGMFKLCEEELADKPLLDGMRRRLLESFLVYYQRLIEQRHDDPAAQAELDATRSRVRQILDDLAVMQGAGQHPLLKEPAVLDNLRLRPGQREQIRELMDAMDRRWKDSFEDFRRLSPDERRERSLYLARLTQADIEKILTAAQRQRLREIALQRKGDRAFDDPDVSAALKLTADQKERIRIIRERTFDLKRKGDRAFDDPDVSAALKLTADQKKQIRIIRDQAILGEQEHPKRLGVLLPPPVSAAIVAQIEEKVLTEAQRQCWREMTASIVAQIEDTVLTMEQRQRWRDLTGEPFKGPFRHPGFGYPRREEHRPPREAAKD